MQTALLFPSFSAPIRAVLLGGVALVACQPALAQQLNEPQTPISAPDAPMPASDDQIGFAADTLEYNSETEIVTASGKAGYVDVFPNLTLRQAFTPNLILRAALSRAINRANFPQLAPRVLETTEGNTIRVESGNPRLNPTLANNVDAGLEYYIRPLGVVSVNGFYKDLTDYRYTLNRQGVYLGLPAIFSSARGPVKLRRRR